MLSAALLMHRRGISKDLLISRLMFVYNEVQARNGLVQLTIYPTTKIMNTYLQYISDFIETKNGVIQPLSNSSKSLMMLSYYRNNLIHIFVNEAEIMTAVSMLTRNKAWTTLEEVFEKTMFLKDLLSCEFVLRDTMRTKEDVDKLLRFMHQRKFLKFEGEKVYIDLNNDEELIKQSFLCQQILPYVDTYALTLAFFSVGPAVQIHEEELTYQKI